MADTAGPLYQLCTPALVTLLGDVENFARGQEQAFTGTPGTLLARTNASGFRYYAHQFYDARGRKVERYLAGPLGGADAEAKAAALRDRIAAAGGALQSIRLLIREGFKFVDSKAYATIAALANHGLFKAGAVLVGSHAYGVLLNQLGARSAQYATKDVDLARGTELALPAGPRPTFLEMLRTSGIPFAEMPNLGRRQPSTSYKEAGRSFFQVDLLVPSGSDEVGIAPVPELRAHAAALPYLRYLLGGSQECVVLAREGCCLSRVPAPERFAIHKLIVSQLRKPGAKARNDVAQAAVLMAVLAEHHPGALEEAADAVPASARKLVTKAAALASAALAAHPRAVQALNSWKTQSA
jgi:hypothetical protein